MTDKIALEDRDNKFNPVAWQGKAGVGLVMLTDTAGNPTNPGGAAGNPVAPKTGQGRIAVAGTQVPLTGTSSALVNGVIVKARDTNAGNLFVGPTGVNTTDDGTGNGYRLQPGEAVSFGLSELAATFINGTNVGDGWYYAAS